VPSATLSQQKAPPDQFFSPFSTKTYKLHIRRAYYNILFPSADSSRCGKNGRFLFFCQTGCLVITRGSLLYNIISRPEAATAAAVMNVSRYVTTHIFMTFFVPGKR